MADATVLQSHVEIFPAGRGPVTCQPGDFVLVRRRGIVQTAIRAGQGIRYFCRNRGFRRDHPGATWVYSDPSHAALITGSDGSMIEALTRGVVRSHVSDYVDVDYVLVRVFASEEDQRQIQAFADSVVGERYGFVTIACLVFSTAPGWHVYFGYDGTNICSGIVALAEERAGAIWPGPAEDVYPADLSWHYSVPERLYALRAVPGVRVS